MSLTPVEMHSRGIAVEHLGRTRAVARGLLAITVPAVVLTARSAHGVGPSPPAIFLLHAGAILVGLVSAGCLLRLRFDPRGAARRDLRASGTVAVHAGEVTLTWGDESRRYTPGEIVEGWIEPGTPGATAVLRTRSGELLSIEIEGAAAGRRLLAAAGVAVHQQRWSTRLANTAATVSWGGWLAGVASILLSSVLLLASIALAVTVVGVSEGAARWADVWGPAAWCAADLLGFFLLLRALVPPVLVVGGDGIALRRFGRRRRFVPYAEIVEVRRDPRVVTLSRRGAEALRLPTGGPESALGHAVHDRIVEAMERRDDDAESSPAAADALDRGGRSAAEWRGHLRGLGQKPEGYRVPSLPPERLATVLEDVASPPERRVAAALALAHVEDPGVRRRVQAAVSSCADDALRHALEAAAADEIAAEELCAVARLSRWGT